MEIALHYPHGTELVMQPEGSMLLVGAAADGRPGVAATARATDPLALREGLRALIRGVRAENRLYHSPETNEQDWRDTLDPLVTVQPDQITCETFSADGGAYGLLAIPASGLTDYIIGQTGTSTAELTWGMGEALVGLRTGLPLTLGIGAAGDFSQMAPPEPVTRTIQLSTAWLRGFLQTQTAMMRRPFAFNVRPADLLTLISFLEEHTAAGPPRALRYELVPGERLSAILEPWEQRITFRSTRYNGYRRKVRLWGRRRLQLLTPLLPFADRVTIALFGRGLPHVYICHLGPYRYLLAINGWSASDTLASSALDLAAGAQELGPERIGQALAFVQMRHSATRDQIAQEFAFSPAQTEQALFALCRAGHVLFDMTSNVFRARELFATPFASDDLFAPDQRAVDAQRLLAAGAVTAMSTRANARRGRSQETWVDAVVQDGASSFDVSLAIDESGRLNFGRCGCPFFQSFIMTRGPCSHILATRLAFDADLASGEAQAPIPTDIPSPDEVEELAEIPF